MRGQLELQRQAVEGQSLTPRRKSELPSMLKEASDELLDAQAGVTAATSQIRAALDDMQNQSFNIGGIVGIVAEIGGAVLSIAAACPRGREPGGVGARCDRPHGEP